MGVLQDIFIANHASDIVHQIIHGYRTINLLLSNAPVILANQAR